MPRLVRERHKQPNLHRRVPQESRSGILSLPEADQRQVLSREARHLRRHPSWESQRDNPIEVWGARDSASHVHLPRGKPAVRLGCLHCQLHHWLGLAKHLLLRKGTQKQEICCCAVHLPELRQQAWEQQSKLRKIPLQTIQLQGPFLQVHVQLPCQPDYQALPPFRGTLAHQRYRLLLHFLPLELQKVHVLPRTLTLPPWQEGEGTGVCLILAADRPHWEYYYQ